jgi:myo-inositol 2-dehydrogenase/D-chiro-inositol 1-dehydrogenase
MKFCVFGAGRMGARHIANIAANERAELAYVVDPDTARAEALAARYRATATDDPARPLSDPAVDAVVIASATDTHVDLIVAAAKAGKAILCEKPIDLDMARVDICAAAIKGCDVPIMIGFQRRFDPTHRAVKDAVDRGEVGRIEVVTIVSRDPAPPPPDYIKKSGGQFHDQMIHDFDLCLWLTGATGKVELFAMTSNLVDPEIGRLGDSDTAEVLMRFADGAFARIDCSRRAAYGYDQRVEVFGAEGIVGSGNVLRSQVERYSSAVTAARDRLQPDFVQRYAASYTLELDSFIDAVRAGAAVEPGFEAGRRALLLADAARRSGQLGLKVAVDLDQGLISP